MKNGCVLVRVWVAALCKWHLQPRSTYLSMIQVLGWVLLLPELKAMLIRYRMSPFFACFSGFTSSPLRPAAAGLFTAKAGTGPSSRSGCPFREVTAVPATLDRPPHSEPRGTAPRRGHHRSHRGRTRSAPTRSRWGTRPTAA